MTRAVIFVYGAMFVVTLAAGIKPSDRWRPYGIYSTLVLWIVQLAWASYGLATG